MSQRKKFFIPQITGNRRHSTEDHMGKHKGQSGGRGSEGENVGKCLYYGFHEKEQARQGKQA